MRNCGYKFMNNNMPNQGNCVNMNTKNCCNNKQTNNSCTNVNNSVNRPQNNGCCNRDCGDNVDNRNWCNQRSMEELKLEIQQCEFSIIELALYLDTHPEDTRAICMHNELCQHYRKLTDEYQKVYGPLTIMFPCNSWRWLEQPWPWQNERNIPNVMNNRGNNECEDLVENNRNECNEVTDYELKGGVK